MDLEVNFNQNKLYIKFKKIIKCCSNCGSVNFLSIGCPFNGKPTLIVCKLRKYVCKDCHSYFVENNPIVYKNSNLTRTAVITILDELKPYTATYSQVGRRFGISTTH
ncbi:MAG: ISL3 family transposase, partial [[Clostridium] spiroforme]|nr:ISL3 family transposase [Thomasclavelia spiroformis]